MHTTNQILGWTTKIALAAAIFACCPAVSGEPLGDQIQQSELSGEVDGNASSPLQGAAQTNTMSGNASSNAAPTFQGSATAVQTRLSRPLAGQADNQILNSGTSTNQTPLPIDFARAFPSLDQDNHATKLHGAGNSDLGIIGEIETLQRPHVVTHVFPSSSAQEAGMMVGDILLTADGQEAIPRWIIGLPGTPVTIVWNHRGEMRTSTLIRREAGLVPMDGHYKEEYLKGVGGFIRQFGQGW